MVLVLISALLSAAALAQRGAAPQEGRDDIGLGLEMRILARRVITTFSDTDPVRHRDGLFRLQIAAGDYSGAVATIDALSPLPLTPLQRDRLEPYRWFAAAKAREASGVAFDEAFRQSFRERVGAVDDKTAFRLLSWLPYNAEQGRRDLDVALDRQPQLAELRTDEAAGLIRQYVLYTVFRDIQPLTRELLAEDDAHRYIIQDDVLIRTPDGATISGVIVRPRSASGRLPTAFTFTIYASTSIPQNARRAAASGYVGVVAFSRGKARSMNEPVPYEHDGDDARAVIDWITRQPWSDGRVGMFGGSYDGFTQWAAAKNPPPALKTIVPYVAAIPGQGLPMENNVFLNANYGWAFYVTNNKYLDEATYNNPPRWSSLNSAWYTSGRPYRDLDRVDGAPNKWLQRWLRHPGFDRYWQAMTAYQRDFSRIRMPVLSITGYYDDAQISALQYVTEHYKYNPAADHYLLIGPWDHFGSQASNKPAMLRGYAIDPVAQVDTPEITFQWLDYVLRGGKKPELLAERINYEEMGSNTWKHAPSIEAMHNAILTLYLSEQEIDSYRSLTAFKPARSAFVEQVVDFTDRTSDTNNYYPGQIIRKLQQPSSGVAFMSEPLDAPVSIAGTLSGVLNVKINKRDMDVGVVLYEVTPSGEQVHLTYFLGRASYARDMTTRHLLTPGRIESIPFNRTRLVSRKLQRGSRLLVVVDVNKNRFSQVNYGTGKDVSDESVGDAGAPLRVQLQSDSYVQIPITK